MQNWKDEDDRNLAIFAQNGDRDAFSELALRHQNTCLKLALSVLHEREDAEDEVQNALWKAYEHIGQFQQDAKFSTWLSRIVLNQCLMRLRQTRRARFIYVDSPMAGEDIAQLDLRSPGVTPEQEMARSEIASLLASEIKRIPPMLRTAFMLRDIQQLPMPNVAEQLGISIAAAKSRLLRARSELKARLERHCGRLGAATLLAEH